MEQFQLNWKVSERDARELRTTLILASFLKFLRAKIDEFKSRIKTRVCSNVALEVHFKRPPIFSASKTIFSP